MIVQCDACNAKFRLDDSKVAAKGVKVRCTKCQNVFVVMPPAPPEETTPPKQEETFGAPFEPTPEPPKKEIEVDLGRFAEQAAAPPKQEEKKAEPSEWGMDFTFETKPKEEEKKEEKKSEWDIGLPSEKEAPQPPKETKEIDFSAPHWGGEEAAPSSEAEKKETAPPSAPSDFSFEQSFAPAEKTSFEIEPPPTEEVSAAPSKEEAKTVIMGGPKKEEAKTVVMGFPPSPQATEELFGKGAEKAKEVSFEAPSEKKALRRIIAIAAVGLLLLIGAGVIYFNMGTRLLPKPSAPQKTMDLVGMKGYYINNTSLGQLFVIEGKVISNLNTSKEVTGIHGILFDKKGKQVKDAWVAPGRIIEQDELKNISTTELEKRFKDRKGMIPPKGTVPFMIVFQGVAGELAEFSVEIGR